ncbi:MAG: antibiotic biosynthesis monooxygenase [Actinobacteria bacterium]|jgi:quinol monooxygenase YgiN|nr:antibiotic biosynthesis monooxygenase [Actinomycetota bacterium]
MNFSNVGTLGALPGKRNDLIAILTRPNEEMRRSGCLFYEVGINDDEPDTVFIAELWESEEAHRASLQLDSVRAAIAEARPLLSGEMGGYRFSVIGSPLRG